MRIISGDFKGKKILGPNDLKTRPLKDLTKESIFNIIKHSKKFSINMGDSEILDLFCGTGSFGIECLSRGVKYVTFVENYSGILPILKKNLVALRKVKNYSIIEKDILKNLDFKNFKKQFDIIFLDPPYKEDELEKIINLIFKESVLKSNGIIIIHRHKKQINVLPNNFRILEKKNYGISKILFGSYI
jgi:16S rRNA (guanine966-N2)-methyltransferase|tara:strand:- start:98 stop:661 length:564 start_codon:yes stop_codon:yes gene_type:complete